MSRRSWASCASRLLKVYGNKDLLFETAIAPGAQFIGDRADLTELLGNLLDNACKWAKARVRIEAAIEPGADSRRALRLVIDDDGPGIAEARSREGPASAAAAPTRRRPVTASASRWCTTPWRCTAERCASTARRSAARASSSNYPAETGSDPITTACYGPSLISKVMPCASGSSRLQLIVLVWRRM